MNVLYCLLIIIGLCFLSVVSMGFGVKLLAEAFIDSWYKNN